MIDNSQQEVQVLTGGENHVNEAKAKEESGCKEEVGLPDHEHHHVDQHRSAKHHAAHRHTYNSMHVMTFQSVWKLPTPELLGSVCCHQVRSEDLAQMSMLQ